MSRWFDALRPIKEHLLRSGGRGGEIADLRLDVKAAFNGVEMILTPDGGFAVPLINKTGGVSVKGTVVEASSSVDFACVVADADSDHNIGVVYTAGVPDGGTIYVVTAGIGYVWLKDTLDATAGYWVGVSDVAGRAFMQANTPALAADHNKEVGHCIQSVAGDTPGVLAACMIHQN